MTLTSEQARRMGRIGGHRVHALHDSRDITAAARAASTTKLNARLLAEIDPDNKLSEVERAKRLKHARSAHFIQIRRGGKRKAATS